MYGIILSAFGWILRYVLGSGAIKWAVLALLWFGATVLVDLMSSLIPAWFDAASLPAMFSFLTPASWYFFDYALAGTALNYMFSAYTARFLIRRIPFLN